MTFFIPGILKNPLNGSWSGWRKHARLAREWREKAACQMLPYNRSNLRMRPKLRITFTAHVGRLWDDDNLPAAIKPVRDEVAWVFCNGNDGPESGHKFIYEQVVSKTRGVKVTVEAP